MLEKIVTHHETSTPIDHELLVLAIGCGGFGCCKKIKNYDGFSISWNERTKYVTVH